jgi:triacylglycerol esterase/lipase EstA (alpha/beta hydrolase family)
MRRIVALLLALQIGAALLIALALVRGAAMAPWLALLCGVGVALLVRLLIGVNNFRVSALHGSPTPGEHRVRAPAALRLFGEEFAATMLNSSWFMLTGRARQRVHLGSGHAPVLLLHGYGCNAGYWRRLQVLLDEAGISHAALDLEPVIADIDGYAAQVGAAIDALCAASDAAQVVIVGHSMGGLVARAYLRAHGPARVAHLFTLGSPHHGTVLANLGLGPNARQMARVDHAASTWLQELAASEDAAARARITSIYSHHDNIVTPQTSSHLPGARNIAMGGVGHVALAHNRRVLTCLMDQIVMLRTR